MRGLAHRIVQEGLTNVLRHAPGARAEVVVRHDAGGLEILVRNTAPTQPGGVTGSGRGLSGLRALVTGSDGELGWGQRADGGFELRAVLPARHLEEADL
jgi:signal transduction histidine kinase